MAKSEVQIKERKNKTYILRKNGSLSVSTTNTEPTLTQQQFKESSDINNIVKKYQQTGELPVHRKVGQFLDVSNVQDYQQSLTTVFEAQKAFDNLPSAIRSRFKNDPQELISFIEDEKNYNEALNLGLINKNPIETPQTKTPQTQTQKTET